jgi:hypothetical protein
MKTNVLISIAFRFLDKFLGFVFTRRVFFAVRAFNKNQRRNFQLLRQPVLLVGRRNVSARFAVAELSRPKNWLARDQEESGVPIAF